MIEDKIQEVMGMIEASDVLFLGMVNASTPHELNDAHRKFAKSRDAIESKLRALLEEKQ